MTARNVTIGVVLLVVLYLLCLVGYSLRWSELAMLPFALALAFAAMFCLESPR